MDLEKFKHSFGIISRSKEINDLIEVVVQLAQSDISVLIYGESGVGKEVFAKALHAYSKRNHKPLISVNCGAIPEGILESELFGHKKGSFTGAIDSRKGYFEIADGGTLFLDEIGEMPLTTQVKLLRVLETKEFMKLGDENVTRVDVRIIAATNRDLQKAVEEKKFREDLYFRLKAVSLNIPPLRKRKLDIEPLAKKFINDYVEQNRLNSIEITDGALNILRNYSWPGNVRELKNTIESAIALNRTGVLDEDSFNVLLIKYEDLNKENRNLPVFLKKSPEDADREFIYRALFEIKKDLVELKQMMFNQRNDEIVVPDHFHNEVVPLYELEREAIRNALDKTRGNRREAADMLKISERTLYRKIKEYRLEND